MMFDPSTLLSRALQIALTFYSAAGPTVRLDTAVVTGLANDHQTQSFLGIPFAEAPRFDAPVPVQPYTDQFDATKYGPACIQHKTLETATWTLRQLIEIGIIPLVPAPENQSEECLSVNVIRPATATPDSNLPVVAWIYGGGLLVGDTQAWDGMGRDLVERSIARSEDVIFVSINYRVSAYGFLGGSEIKEAGAGNAALRDQREGLRWIQKYIRNFGGDPNKVIVWGQSAGAFSASLQMLAYDGNTSGLFRGVFAQSGAPLPVGPIDGDAAQERFEDFAEVLGCEGNNKLECLRSVPLEDLRKAVDATDSFFSQKSLALTWHPAADGDFLTDKPYELIRQDKVAHVPLVTGNMDDEGTFFSVATAGLHDLSTERRVLDWIKAYWAPKLTPEEEERFKTEYPNDVTKGSPFDTGSLNQLFGNRQYKRVAAFQDDMIFQAPRRFFTEALSNKTDVWVYLSKQFKQTPYLGSSHGSDVQVDKGYFPLNDHVVKFANSLDPNIGDGTTSWPRYDTNDPKLYLFPAGCEGMVCPPPEVAEDNDRVSAFKFLTELAEKYPKV